MGESSGPGEVVELVADEIIVIVEPHETATLDGGARHISESLAYAEVQPNLLVGVGTSAIETAAVSAPAEDTFFVKESFENIYFDFNRWAIPTPMVERLTAHASWLRAHSGSEVRIEGHCDIRGSREYNMVLGERRARSVKDFLLDLGVKEVQLSLISYGKERLTCFEGKEGCHQDNRRAHLMLK
ncbi:MAG TPA: hypothetical protein EYN74_05835 [Nitrospirales bacterium]|nr:hypothetical protein [Nitrospirales bacterium]HIN33131.1 hypothetical protein [Nitrospirales bacterium]